MDFHDNLNLHRHDQRLVLAGFALGILYWIVESLLHVFVFDASEFTHQLFTPSSHEAWMRFIVMLGFIAFGYYAQRLLRAWKNAEHKAAVANAELSQIFETSADGMRIVDRDFNVIQANETFAALVGMDKGQIVGHKCHAHFRGELCNTPRCPLTRILEQEQRLEYDVEKVRINGSRIPCIVTATPFRSPGGEILGIVEDFKDISERRHWETRLMQSRKQLGRLTAHLQVIREQERRRIAREIHDELGQSLTALNMDTHWLKRHLPGTEPSLSDKIDDMQALVARSAQAVHRISSELRPGILDDFGLSAAIHWQAQEFTRHSGIPCSVKSEPDDILLDEDLSIAMFRVLQESLTNIARHAGASRVDIQLRHHGNRFEMRIQDNGRGLTRQPFHREQRFGLIGMQERLRDLGGSLQIDSPRGGGVIVQVSLRTDPRERDRHD